MNEQNYGDSVFLIACLQVVLAHPPGPLSISVVRQLTCKGRRIFNFQRTTGEIENPLTTKPIS